MIFVCMCWYIIACHGSRSQAKCHLVASDHRMRRNIVALLLAAGLADGSQLQTAFQSLVDGLSQKYGYAMQIAWRSDIEDFTVAAGHHAITGKAVTAEDTFAFGSGTKPYTAVLLLKLASEGKIELDRPASEYVDGILKRMNGTSMVGLFGADAAKVTVGHLLRMQSGLADFDVSGFDDALLKQGGSVHSPLEFLHAAAKQSPVFLCNPGQCTSYTSHLTETVLTYAEPQRFDHVRSVVPGEWFLRPTIAGTNYVLAGFVALGAVAPTSDWTSLDQAQIFPQPASAKYQKCTFADTGSLNKTLDIPGAAGSFLRRTQIYGQDASILGWTCGNLIAPAGSAAEFFYDLLIAKRIVPSEMVAKMQEFAPLNVGWAKGMIQYGTGLMIQQASWNATYPPVMGSWGSYVGHGGDTYGFLSESGVLSQFNASFSATANEEYLGPFVKNVMVCTMIRVAAKVLLDQDVFLKCGVRPFPQIVV
ncbi:unnamed protein product [Durusdinium trenchii]|uniref:Beta-lactamase-related domain-containing protein n=1 Tax=Durusdinium trenchii TaxID=1381693 RepID=A0ABP0M4J5_9DINO